MSQQMTRAIMADAIGLVVLAVLVGLISLFVPGTEVPSILWVFIYVVWAACTLFVWHHQKAPERTVQWLLLAVASMIVAPLWYGIAGLVARLAFASTEPELSKAFDLLVTLMITPGFTFIAITGWVRALLRSKWISPTEM